MRPSMIYFVNQDRASKNDISFVLGGRTVLLVEHQSSINNNMCIRDLIYITELIKNMIKPKDLYKETQIKIPTPEFVLLYNGTRYMPAYHEMKLSDAYIDDSDNGKCSLQLVIKVYNINSRAGSEILEKSETLRQYSLFVERVREYSKDNETLTEREMVDILNSCIDEDILAEFLGRYGTEAIGMMFKELTQEEALEMSRQDGYALGVEKGRNEGLERGRSEGLEQGIAQGRTEGEASGRAERELEMAKAMKAKGYPAEEIAELTGIPIEEIESL